MKRQWYYRGSLKSCNYKCGYCPFSKRKDNYHELQLDREAFFRFIRQMNSSSGIEGAVQIIPYGEALIHEYYWEGLAALSQNPRLDAAGAQSNFSFSVEKMLSIYKAHGGIVEKLRLWGTFHPQMTNTEDFLEQCRQLDSWKVSYCAGAVGVPEHLELIRDLRKELPDSIYLWINKMKGMKRKYTEAEKKAFTEIDPYFDLELAHHRADSSKCNKNRFIEADGTMHWCNLCRQVIGNLYHPIRDHEKERNEELKNKIEMKDKDTACTRKECSCYLAYCSGQMERLFFFYPYPAFRIPVYPKAVFFDIDGTLIPKGQRQIPESYIQRLEHLARYSDLYFATSLPPETARRKAGQLWDRMDGGVFAAGARCMIFEKKGRAGTDQIHPLENLPLSRMKEMASRYGCQMHVYKKGSRIYKITFSVQKKGEHSQIFHKNLEQIKQIFSIPDFCGVLQEENCIQITKKGVGKLPGVLYICEKMGYPLEDIAVFGNGAGDMELLANVPFSAAAKGSSDMVKKCARYYFEGER